MANATAGQIERLGVVAAGLVRSGERVGLGSGRASLAFVRALGRRVREEGLEIVGVPTSMLTEEVAREAGISIGTLEAIDSLDIAIDGADEVDPDFNCIKGGGGNLAREKVVEWIAKRFVLVVGEEKIVERLGTHFPVFVEIFAFSQPVVVRALEAMGAKVTQRKNKDGSAFLTDNGNPYLEAVFKTSAGTTQLADAAAIDRALHGIPGVVETGLFINMVDEVLVAHADGRIEHKR